MPPADLMRIIVISKHDAFDPYLQQLISALRKLYPQVDGAIMQRLLAGLLIADHEADLPEYIVRI